MKITFDKIRDNREIRAYIITADEALTALGYTEHCFTHVTKVAETAKNLLLACNYSERDAELAQIAGYLHDIGNIVNRVSHAQSGAIMAFNILHDMGGDPREIATIVSAIGNHDESTAFPVNPIAAAVIIADKSDVRSSRVRNTDISTFDIHDRVNYSVKKSTLTINKEQKTLRLDLTIDTSICPVMNYFEIFLKRMVLCRKSAEVLGLEFQLEINDQRLL